MMDGSQLLDRILHALEPYELRTFVIGFDRPVDYDRARHEEEFRGRKRQLGEEISRRRAGVDADFLRPEIRIDIAPDGVIRIQSAPLFIAGRYRKLSREIPATRWIHHACHGKGCPVCNYTGNLCGPSIQELLEKPVLRLSGGRRSLLHGLGREDVDARMLGAGRPFVLEVHHPVRRSIDLNAVSEELERTSDGLAEILGLTPVGPEARSAVKLAAAQKTYRAWVQSESPITASLASRIEQLSGALVAQLSPQRIMHRRGRDIVRQRRVIESCWIGEVDGRQAWEVRVEAGMYVKELVSGDEGRTQPSLTQLLGQACRCVALDVLEVHWDPPWELRNQP